MKPIEQVQHLRLAWKNGGLSFPALVVGVEAAVRVVRETMDEPASRYVWRTWGQLEIINAIALSLDAPLNSEDIRDAEAFLDELEKLLRDQPAPESLSDDQEWLED
jgi:hypothetical protein